MSREYVDKRLTEIALEDNFDRILGLFAGTAKVQRQFKSAYEAGRDAGLNGSNVANSHFSWFSSREQANEWDRGKLDALNGRAGE